MSELTIFEHQAQFAVAPWHKDVKDINDFFMIAGYGAGKTFADSLLVLNLVGRYSKFDVNIGLGATSNVFLKKTLIGELLHLFDAHHVPFNHDGQANIITVNRMRIFGVNLEDRFYGFNFSAFISDELDELNHDKAMDANLSIKERTRTKFPDGRLPFRAYSSTSQGYKSLYRITEEMKDKKRPFMLLRAETRMNLLLPKEYIEDLKASYTAEQQLAWLEGRFVNLTTGRVYPQYDDSKHRLKVPAFEISPHDLVRAGQDFNPGFSRGVATVLRDGVIHCVRSFEFGDISSAPKQIRAAFPGNVIEWYPDASSWQVVLGYRAEVKAYDIICRVGEINPTVIDRIYFVNSLFKQGKLVLWPDCNRLSMALKTRSFTDKGDPEKGKGPTDVSHDCDALEYVIWRIVGREKVFQTLLSTVRESRRTITDRQM